MLKNFLLSLFVLLLFILPHASAERIVLNTFFQNEAPPRYFVENSKDTGIAIDIITALNQRLDKANIVIKNNTNAKVPMKRIVRYLEQGKDIELFVGGAKNLQRMAMGQQFSRPLYMLTVTFAKHRDNDFTYSSISSLDNLHIGVLRGGRSEQMLKTLSNAHVFSINTIEQGLQMLALKRIDLLSYHQLGLAWNIQHLALNDTLVLISPDEYLEQIPHYIIYSKNISKSLIATIDTVIEAMKKDGTMNHILAKYL